METTIKLAAALALIAISFNAGYRYRASHDLDALVSATPVHDPPACQPDDVPGQTAFYLVPRTTIQH